MLISVVLNEAHHVIKKLGQRCHEVGGNALTVYVLKATRASSILVKGSANLLSFHTTRLLKSDMSLYTQAYAGGCLVMVVLPVYFGQDHSNGNNAPLQIILVQVIDGSNRWF